MAVALGAIVAGATPASAIALATAVGPGTTSTDAPAERAAATTLAPGSETPGMPASVVSASVWPAASRWIMAGSRSAALCRLKEIVAVDLARPRDMTSDAFNRYRRDITRLIQAESRKVFASALG